MVAVELQLTALSALCFVDSVSTCSPVYVMCRSSSKTGFDFSGVDAMLLLSISDSPSSSLMVRVIWSKRQTTEHCGCSLGRRIVYNSPVSADIA